MNERLIALVEKRLEVEEVRMAMRKDAAVIRSANRQKDRWEIRGARAWENWLKEVTRRVDLPPLVKETRESLTVSKALSDDSTLRLEGNLDEEWERVWGTFLKEFGEDVPSIIGERARAKFLGLLAQGTQFDDAWKETAQAIQDDLGIVEKSSILERFANAWHQAGETLRNRILSPLAAQTIGRIRDRIHAQIGDHADYERGGMGIYLSMAHDISEEAGQHGLDGLGLNRTFRWTTERDMVRDQFAVRGSKILQHAVGSHGDSLARIIVRATDPAHPQSLQQTVKQIRDEWGVLTKSEAERIARTETATIWETTHWNTMRNNNVRSVDWTIAKGPSIGPPKSLPVCPQCLEEAAGNPHPINEIDLPPKHPNCRCHLVPRLPDDWLPPATTWDGGPQPPLPLQEAPTT